MKTKFFTLLSILLLAGLLSGCVGYSATSWPGMTVDAKTGVAYLANDKTVYAVDLKTGVKIWTYPEKAGTKVFYAPPVLTPDGQLIVAGFDHVLYSLNPTTGLPNAAVFKDAKNRYVAAPLVTRDAIYAATNDGSVYALDFSLKPRWAKPFRAKAGVWASPVTDGKYIFIASMDHHVYALEPLTGQVKWQKNLGAAMVGTPAVVDGKLFVGTFGKEFYALNTETGDIVGQPTTTEGWVWAGPTVTEQKIYFADLDGNLYAIDRTAGTATTLSNLDGAVLSAPLVVSDTLYVTTDTGILHILTLEGKASKPPVSLVKDKKKPRLYAPAYAYQDMILLTPVSGDGLLVALDTKNSMLQAWIFPPPKSK